MKKVQTIDELLTVLKACREGLAERFGVLDLAVFGISDGIVICR
jgi:hypothetical protein